MKHIRILAVATLTLGLFVAAGCQDESGAGQDGESDTRSDVPMDSQTPEDTISEDSGDTSGDDGSGDDTSTGDTEPEDSGPGDTDPVDTGSDTAAMDTGSDTSEMDTAPEDTGSDTASKDTSGDTDADGGFECPEQQSGICNPTITCYEEQSTGNCCKYSNTCPLMEPGWRQLQNCRSDCKDVTSR